MNKQNAPGLVETTEACPHRWVLETPNGPEVRGCCRACGVQRDFLTAVDGLWYSEPWSDPATRQRAALTARSVREHVA